MTAEVKRDFAREREGGAGEDAGELFAIRKAGDDLRGFPIRARALLECPRALDRGAAIGRGGGPAGLAVVRREECGGDFRAPCAQAVAGLCAALGEGGDRALEHGGLRVEVSAELPPGERDERVDALGGEVLHQAGKLLREHIGGDIDLLEEREAEQRGVFAGDGEHDVEQRAEVGGGEAIEREAARDVGRAELVA